MRLLVFGHIRHIRLPRIREILCWSQKTAGSIHVDGDRGRKNYLAAIWLLNARDVSLQLDHLADFRHFPAQCKQIKP